MDIIALIKAAGDAFILFLFPLIGLAIESRLPRKTGYWIISIAILLLIPIFTPWHYIIPYVYRTLLLIISSVAFAIYLQSPGRTKYKSRLSLIWSLLLFLGLGFMLCINSLFIGKKDLEKKWVIKNYNVEYTANWGFTGQALMQYELNQYGIIPFFVRNLESVIEYDTMTSCTIHFPQQKMIFNKCNGTLEKISQ